LFRSGSFAAPEGNRWRCAVRILHANAAGLDAPNTPGCSSQQKHIAGETLDGEVFIERSDDRFFRFGDDKIIRVLRNRATGCDGCEPRSSPAADDVIDLIAVEKSAAAAALRGDSFGEHADNGIEVLSR